MGGAMTGLPPQLDYARPVGMSGRASIAVDNSRVLTRRRIAARKFAERGHGRAQVVEPLNSPRAQAYRSPKGQCSRM
jgi:hypothetical protein